MNKHLVEFSEKLHSSGPSLVPGLIMIFVSLCLLIVFSTIQVNYYLLNAEAQLINSNVSNIGNNTNGIDNIIRNGTLDIGSNNTVQDLTLPELFEKAERSVVQVTTSSETGDLNLSRSGIGSGFVYNNDGMIVTNYHVISTGSSPPTNLAQDDTSREVDINVAFEDGSIYPATLVGSDRGSDVAVIDVPEEARNKLVPLPIGNSSELRVGQQVVAIGNPFGLSGSMTEGIVSGLGRLIPSSEEDRLPQIPDGTPESPPQDPSIPGLPPPLDQVPPNVPDEGARETTRLGSFSIPDVIQTDAPINPGNSGGPLLDLRGNVIGMNTAIFSSTGESAGVGFAIPSNTVSKVVPSLISSGVYQHPWLGISGTDITPEIAAALGLDEARGFLVTDITAGSPADKAGVRGGYKIDDINGMEIALGGDIIVGIDNMTVTTPENVVTSLKGKQAGDTVQLDVIRNGQTNRVELTLGEIPQAALQGRQGEGQQPGLEIIP